MANPSSEEIQRETLKVIWEHYRAQAKTSRRLKSEQGQWRRLLLIATIIALIATPFSKSLDKFGLAAISYGLTVVAAVLFGLVAWLNKEVLGDDSQQSWVRARQTGEGLKALAYRFLGGVPPFDTPDGVRIALDRAAELVDKTGIAPDPVDVQEREQNIPPAPLTVGDFIKLRLDDQVAFYSNATAREKKADARVVKVGRWISASVVVFGALGASVAKDWRDIWVPFLGAAGTMVTTQMTVARRRFLIESYSAGEAKLKFARTRWNVSPKSTTDADQLVESVESILAMENAGWVQQMLLRPVVPDSPSVASKANP